jgi:hypothetical protein
VLRWLSSLTLVGLLLMISGLVASASPGGPAKTSPMDSPLAKPAPAGWDAWPADLSSPPIEALLQDPGLLVNGNFDQLPFYWRVPNHFIAGGWARWWMEGSVIPEFDDVRSWRPWRYDGDHAQVYFKWGNTYEAGIYQVVTGLTPCVPYRLTMWARNHSLDGVLPHARIGLDPQGTPLTTRAPIGPNDEDSVVRTGLPPLTVWSREQTSLFTWEELSVEAEPLGDRLTVILYAYPEHPSDGRTYYFDTFWDAGRLITSTYPGGRLPEPVSWTSSGFITNVVVTPVLDSLVIEWETLAPAPTQVWYDVFSPVSPSITGTLPYTVYLPLVLRSPFLQNATPLDLAPVTHHRAVIPGLQDGQTVRLYLLSRRPLTDACITEAYGPIEVTVTVPPIIRTYLPLVLRASG